LGLGDNLARKGVCAGGAQQGDVENVIDTGWGIQAVGVRINDFCDGKFAVLVVELLRGPVCFNVLKVKPDLIPNIEADRWLAVPIREFFLLLLCRGHRSLCPVPCLT
jgi:hypothetical protein